MKQKDILIIIILFFILTLIWIGSGIYHSAISSTISEKINKDISPIEPVFDIKTIEKLKERQKITPTFELENVASTSVVLPTLETSPQSGSEEARLLL